MLRWVYVHTVTGDGLSKIDPFLPFSSATWASDYTILPEHQDKMVNMRVLLNMLLNKPIDDPAGDNDDEDCDATTANSISSHVFNITRNDFVI